MLFGGRRHTALIGKSVKSVPAANALSVYQSLVELGFWSLRDEYVTVEDGCTRVATDHPTHTWTVERDGESKTVKHYLGCDGVAVLAELEAVEDLLREEAGLAEWIGR